MIAQAKQIVYSDPKGYEAVPSTDGSKLIVSKNGRAIAFLRGDATKADFWEIVRAHSIGYHDGRQEAKDEIGGTFRNFLLLIGIDPEDMDSRVEKLEERISRCE